jgi:predicted transcriptional regulator
MRATDEQNKGTRPVPEAGRANAYSFYGNGHDGQMNEVGLLSDTTSFAANQKYDIISAEALALYDLGLHVFPLPHGKKTPFGSHRKLQTSRLDRGLLAEACTGCNLAVFAGRLSGGLCILDCDTASDFESILSAFEARGLWPWIRGGTGGGGQFWFRVDDGEAENAVLRPADAPAVIFKVEVLGFDLYSVVPPSVHPDTGEVYEWAARDTPEPPRIAMAMLDFLPLRRRTHQRRRTLRTEKLEALPLVADRVLIERDASDYDGDNSRAEYAACLSMIQAGYPDDHILHLFEHHPPPHFRRAGQRNFSKYVLAKARAWAEEHPLDAGRANVPTVPSSAYVAWAWRRPWPRRTGNTDRAVFLALCERLRMESGVMPVRSSIREVAELAGVSRDTAHRALGRLAEQGVICVHVEEDAAYRYDLTVEVGQGLTATGAPVVARGQDSRTKSYCPGHGPPLEAHDAWQPGALGKSALAVWGALRDSPGQATAQLVAGTGRGRSTVKRVLNLLTLHGLVTSKDRQHEAIDVTREVLDKIASLLRTAGTAARRKAQHSQERALYVTNDLLNQQERHRHPPA